jgi:hypothetical protein
MKSEAFRRDDQITKVRSVQELLPAITQGARAALFEERAPNIDFTDFIRVFDARVIANLFGNYLGEAPDLKNLEARMQESRKALNAIYLQKIDLATAEKVLSAYDAICVDILQILKEFPRHSIGLVLLSVNRYVDDTASWHYDGKPNEGHLLRIVRTYAGQHTLYNTSHNKTPRQDQIVSIPGPGISLHRFGPEGAWHKAAYNGSIKSPRIVATITLRPL